MNIGTIGTESKIGNTNQGQSCKIKGKYRHWFFTLNNYKESDIENILEQNFKCYAFQEELGKQGTKHLQGCISLKSPRYLSGMKKIDKRIHWEVCRNIKAAKDYCLKLNTRNGKQYIKGYPKPVYDLIAEKGALDWQRKIINYIKDKVDSRKIKWIYEPDGNTGKSVLAKHLVLLYNAIVVGGSHKDAQFAISERVKKNEDINIVIFDIPRSMGNRISYIAIENIKNGLFFSSKYESNMVCFNTPHVIVFSNCEPEYTALSMDRWDVELIS